MYFSSTVFLIFLFCSLSCSPKDSYLLLPKMDSHEKQIITLLSTEKIPGIRYHHASIKNEDIVVIVSYPEWSRKKIQLLGQVAVRNTPGIFTINPNLHKITFYVVNGSKNFAKKHFISLSRTLWENPPLILSGHDNPLMAYEIAETYYVGSKISGKLRFRTENQELTLPPQKPMS